MRLPARAVPVLGVVLFIGCAAPEQIPVTPEITTTVLDDAVVGSDYSGQLQAAGGTGPYTWTLESLPEQLSWLTVVTVDSTIGQLGNSDLPDTYGSFSFIARVTDSQERTSTRVLTLKVNACTGASVACFYVENGTCKENSLVCDGGNLSNGDCGGGSLSSDVNHCGSSCKPCPGNSDTCTSSVCTCGANAACSGNSDTCTNRTCMCGTNAACTTTVTNAHPVCSSGQCSYACDTNYMPCSIGCCPQATAVSGGGDRTCALMSGGTVQCWGGNGFGELGNNSTTDSHVPVSVLNSSGTAALSGVQAIAAGDFCTCALVNSAVQCWGRNNSGQLGNNSTADSHVPVNVRNSSDTADLSGVQAIAAGQHHTCALMNGGTVQCWGFNYSGQLGNNSAAVIQPVPVNVRDSSGAALSGVQAITAGILHTCALMNGGTVQCWGDNVDGQLGNNSTTNSVVPVNVIYSSGANLSGVQAIGAGYDHTCALMNGGTVQCWGYNYYGELGNNSTNSHVPVNVLDPSGGANLSGVQAIGAGYNHTCALMNGGTVQCWGRNNSGQLGNNSTNNSTVPVNVIYSSSATLSGVQAIAAGQHHTCALASGGAVQCWGYNNKGQLGNNSTTDSHVPVSVQF